MSKQTHLNPAKAKKLFWRDDWQRVKDLKIPGRAAPVYRQPDTIRLLRATNEFFTADAVWRRKDGIWSCTDADKPLRWMLEIPFDSIRNDLLKRGCSWKWLPIRNGKDGTDPTPSLSGDGTPCNKLQGTNPGDGITKPMAGATVSKTGPVVASPSLQTGAQPTAAECLSSGLVATAGG